VTAPIGHLPKERQYAVILGRLTRQYVNADEVHSVLDQIGNTLIEFDGAGLSPAYGSGSLGRFAKEGRAPFRYRAQ